MKDFEWLKKNHPATMMKQKFTELRNSIKKSGNPDGSGLLKLIDSAEKLTSVTDANQVYIEVALKHKCYMKK
jgi:hypothetical protein